MNISTNSSINHVNMILNAKQSKYYLHWSVFTDFNEFEIQRWTKLFANSMKIF